MVLKRKPVGHYTRNLLLYLLGGILLATVVVAVIRHAETLADYVRGEHELQSHLIDEYRYFLKSGDNIETFVQDSRAIYPYFGVYRFSTSGVTLDSLTSGRIMPSAEVWQQGVSHYINNNEANEEGYRVLENANGQSHDLLCTYKVEDGHVMASIAPLRKSWSMIFFEDWGFNAILLFVSVSFAVGAVIIARYYGRFIDRLYVFVLDSEKNTLLPADEYGQERMGLNKLYCRIINMYALMQQTAEERERDKQAALREVQDKIKMKRELTNNINHELKTPVASISGYVETLMNNPELDAEVRQMFLEKCFAQTERLASLLRDVSTISRLEEIGLEQAAMEKVDVHKLIQAVYSDVIAQRDKKHFNLHINFSAPTFVYGDFSLIQSIFQNLTNNAVAYSSGQDIFVRIVAENKDFYTFVFADNGVGVDEVHIPHLFERFYRADKGRSRKLGGTGLGLAIVKNAVIQHGGRISVENSEYGGLQFTFSLPKHKLPKHGSPRT